MTYFSSKDNGDQDEESHGGENAGILESNWLHADAQIQIKA